MKTTVLDTAADLAWLREKDRAINWPRGAYLGLAVLYGNEDSPDAVDVYDNESPLITEPFQRIAFDSFNLGDAQWCIEQAATREALIFEKGARAAREYDAERGRYNGWTNYATWVVNLWIDNDEGAQDYWRERAEDLVKSAIEDGESEPREEAARNLADELKNHFEEDAEESAGVTGALSDLLSHALGLVEWQEIAEHYTADIELFAAGWNMPGYMPDSEPSIFTDWADARDYIADEMESFADQAEDDTESQEQAEEMRETADQIRAMRGGPIGVTVSGYHYWVNQI